MPVEIAVQDPAGAHAAARGGAERLEICSALALGGLTPSIATLELSLEAGLPSLPLVRCRPGDFVYNDSEIAVTERDITAAMKAGAAGAVVGALKDGALDREALKRWAGAARDVNPEAHVVIHRCVDVLQGGGVGAEQLAGMLQGLGITRILTSGGAPTVPEGLEALAALHRVLEPLGIEVQAGGGLTLESIPALVQAGITNVHSSASIQQETGPTGPGGGSDETIAVTSEEKVAAFVQALRAAA